MTRTRDGALKSSGQSHEAPRMVAERDATCSYCGDEARGGKHVGYDAFISYSHAADGQLAPAVQAALQRMARPWWKKRALQVFRDETGLAVDPHMWQSIKAVLNSSEWFVLFASPEAANSAWVNLEIEEWLRSKPAERILPVLTGGEAAWDPRRTDFAECSTAIPAALRHRFREEPRHLDLRWARSETDLDLRHSRFRDAIANLAAPMHGMRKDEFESEDVRIHRRAMRLARAGVMSLLVFAAVAVIGVVLALGYASRANAAAARERRSAENARLARQEADRQSRNALVSARVARSAEEAAKNEADSARRAELQTAVEAATAEQARQRAQNEANHASLSEAQARIGCGRTSKGRDPKSERGSSATCHRGLEARRRQPAGSYQGNGGDRRRTNIHRGRLRDRCAFGERGVGPAR
jgi:hypothetical protein